MKHMILVATFSLSVALATASAPASALAQPSEASSRSTTQTCQDAWNASSASRTCRVNSIIGLGMDGTVTGCRGDVDCMRDSGDFHNNKFTMDDWAVRGLTNCDGYLDVNGC